MFNSSFNSATFTADNSREVLPAGVYTARIIEAGFGPLKSGNGYAVSLTYEIIEGEHSRRRVWSSLNVIHNNPDAQRIAQSELKRLCDACGGVTVTDTTTHLLMGKVLRIKLKIRQDPQYGDKNAVNGYEALPAGSQPPVAGSAQSSVPGTPRPAPWANA